MTTSRQTIGTRALRFTMAGIAFSCLGVAVIAAPMTPRNKVLGASKTSVEHRSAYEPLAKGVGFQLQRAARGEDEDCVRVTRMTGPDGRIYVTRGLICAD
jgi:hypothetical protein